MKRLFVMVVCWSSLALAGGNKEVEARAVLAGFLRGEVGLNQAVNRFAFLGVQRFAAHELMLSLSRFDDERKRAQIYEAIALVVSPPPDPDVENALWRATFTDDTARKIVITRALARMHSIKGYLPLLSMLKDHQAPVRRAAATSLGEMGLPAAGAPLAAALQVEDDFETKVTLLVAIGKAGDKRQAAVLEPTLTQTSEVARLAAAQALCQLGSPKGVAFAKQLMASKDANERLQGVRLFDGVQAKQATPNLSPMLADVDHRVRATAARILAQGGDKSKVDWLVLESSKSVGEDRLPYENELETLRLSDEDRRAILKRAGVQ